MRLYRLHRSTNVERVALALAYKGVEVESVWVEPDDREPVEQVSGQPLVPVIEEVAVSVAVMVWLPAVLSVAPFKKVCVPASMAVNV